MQPGAARSINRGSAGSHFCKSEIIIAFHATEIPFVQIILGVGGIQSVADSRDTVEEAIHDSVELPPSISVSWFARFAKR